MALIQRTVFMQEANIIGYPDHYVQSTERHPMQYLAAQIKSLALDAKYIGVEMDNYWFSAAAYQALQKDLPNSTFNDATGLVNWQRAVKSPAELAYMRKAGQIVGRMHERIRERAEVGLRKCDLWPIFMMLHYGLTLKLAPVGIIPLGTAFALGLDAAAPHLTWDDQPLKQEGHFSKLPAWCIAIIAHCPARCFWANPPKHSLMLKKLF